MALTDEMRVSVWAMTLRSVSRRANVDELKIASAVTVPNLLRTSGSRDAGDDAGGETRAM